MSANKPNKIFHSDVGGEYGDIKIVITFKESQRRDAESTWKALQDFLNKQDAKLKRAKATHERQ